MMTNEIGHLARPQMERLVEKGILSRPVVDKAVGLFEDGAVTLDRHAGGSAYFAVKGSREAHDIIYRLDRKRWMCDCEFFSLKTKYCSHILAVHLFLESRNPLQ